MDSVEENSHQLGSETRDISIMGMLENMNLDNAQGNSRWIAVA